MERVLNPIDEQAVITTRFAYRMLMTVCVTAFIFVSSPQEKNVLDSGLKEINELINLDIIPLISKTAFHNSQSLSSLKNIEKIFKKHNLVLDLTKNKKYFFNRKNFIYVQEKKLSLTHSKLEDINNYYTTLNQLSISIMRFDDDDIKFFDESLKYHQADYRSSDGSAQKVQLLFSNKNYHLTFENGYYMTSGLKNNPKRDSFTIPFNLLEFIHDSPEHRLLVHKIEEDWIFIPNLKELWDQVRTENPIQARAILARQNKPKESTLQVFGLSIPRKLISWIIPAVTLAISIYLFAHMLFLQKIISRNSIVGEYPWVAIMPGRLPFTVVIITILIFPGLALIGTVMANWDSGGVLLQSLSIFTSVFTMLILAACLSVILKIRSNTNGNNLA